MKPGSLTIAEIAIHSGASQKPGELAELIDAVARVEPKVILEIGSMDGGTLRAWKAMAPDATLISVSLTGGPFGGGEVPKGIAEHHFNLDSHNPETLSRVMEILDDRPVDFLFIDGDHTYEGVRQDFAMYGWLVRRGGIIALHDILFHPATSGVEVKDFWADLTVRHETAEFVQPQLLRDNQPWGGIGAVYQ